MKTYEIVTHGKWGGTRSQKVTAKSAADARKRAYMRLDERVGRVTKVSA